MEKNKEKLKTISFLKWGRKTITMKCRTLNLWEYVSVELTDVQKKEIKLTAALFLNKLKPLHRRMLEHRYNLEDGSIKLSFRKIAKLMDTSHQNVYLLHNRCLPIFRNIIRQYYLGRPTGSRMSSDFIRIGSLAMSERARNGLRSLGIETLGELTRTSRSTLMKAKYFGPKSMRDVENMLNSIGLRLADG